MRLTLKIKRITSTVSIVMLLLINTLAAQAQQTPSREYQLKAVFLFNFTQFVDWPAGSFGEDQSPLVIGILGDDPFGSYLEQTVAEEKTNGHPVEIRHYSNAEEIKTCHILFINFSDVKKREQAISFLKGRNILTVSDAADFSELGGMIRFFNKDNKIKLEINPEASREANLVLSSKLLRAAEIFSPKQK